MTLLQNPEREKRTVLTVIFLRKTKEQYKWDKYVRTSLKTIQYIWNFLRKPESHEKAQSIKPTFYTRKPTSCKNSNIKYFTEYNTHL